MTGTLPGLKLFSQAEGNEGETCSGIAKVVCTGEVTGRVQKY
ncbi:MAG: hypothetical protein JWO23_306, partial [Solirubrobacterales bacterium]|nr:hypothetical protein [Solirubrobacterales bacterium]